MNKKDWQHLNERLTETAMSDEANGNWADAAAAWNALAELREEEDGSPIRKRAKDAAANAAKK